MTTQWQHELFSLPDRKSEIEKALNEKSNKGWEIVNVFHHTVLLHWR